METRGAILGGVVVGGLVTFLPWLSLGFGKWGSREHMRKISAATRFLSKGYYCLV